MQSAREPRLIHAGHWAGSECDDKGSWICRPEERSFSNGSRTGGGGLGFSQPSDNFCTGNFDGSTILAVSFEGYRRCQRRATSA